MMYFSIRRWIMLSIWLREISSSILSVRLIRWLSHVGNCRLRSVLRVCTAIRSGRRVCRRACHCCVMGRSDIIIILILCLGRSSCPCSSSANSLESAKTFPKWLLFGFRSSGIAIGHTDSARAVCAHFGIRSSLSSLVSLPKRRLARTRCIVVRRARTESFFSFVIPAQEDLES